MGKKYKILILIINIIIIVGMIGTSVFIRVINTKYSLEATSDPEVMEKRYELLPMVEKITGWIGHIAVRGFFLLMFLPIWDGIKVPARKIVIYAAAQFGVMVLSVLPIVLIEGHKTAQAGLLEIEVFNMSVNLAIYMVIALIASFIPRKKKEIE